MEQISIFGIADINDALEQICRLLNLQLKENGLEGLSASTYELKSASSATKRSVAILDNVVTRIYIGKKVQYLEFPVFEQLSDCKSNTYEKVYISGLDEIPSYFDKIKETCQHILDSTTKDFSCCSRYEECSDAKICTHPDKEIAMGCYYRRVLHRGKIFYGKNRNV